MLPGIRAKRQQRFHHESPESLPSLLLLDLGDDQGERLAGSSRTESAYLSLALLLAPVVLRVPRRRRLRNPERPPRRLECLGRVVEGNELVGVPSCVARN